MWSTRARTPPTSSPPSASPRAHNLRLVIKGRGHSYFGGSNAPDSLLLWTRHMDDVTVHDAFTPAGSNAAPVPAVSCGAGAMWLHAYQAVSVGAGRYVQGGGCTTVGVAGLVQGGGFGSFSKGFGTAAASLLEAEIVTADGKVRVVNHVQEPELFWALKGGGGGTFGVRHPADARHARAAGRTSAPCASPSTPSRTTPSAACWRASSSSTPPACSIRTGASRCAPRRATGSQSRWCSRA